MPPPSPRKGRDGPPRCPGGRDRAPRRSPERRVRCLNLPPPSLAVERPDEGRDAGPDRAGRRGFRLGSLRPGQPGGAGGAVVPVLALAPTGGRGTRAAGTDLANHGRDELVRAGMRRTGRHVGRPVTVSRPDRRQSERRPPRLASCLRWSRGRGGRVPGAALPPAPPALPL